MLLSEIRGESTSVERSVERTLNVVFAHCSVFYGKSALYLQSSSSICPSE